MSIDIYVVAGQKINYKMNDDTGEKSSRYINKPCSDAHYNHQSSQHYIFNAKRRYLYAMQTDDAMQIAPATL